MWNKWEEDILAQSVLQSIYLDGTLESGFLKASGNLNKSITECAYKWSNIRWEYAELVFKYAIKRIWFLKKRTPYVDSLAEEAIDIFADGHDIGKKAFLYLKEAKERCD